jgi:CheY-like chemotaxis protein
MDRPLVVVIDASVTIRKIFEVCLRREGGIEYRGYADPLVALRVLSLPGAQMPNLVFVALEHPQARPSGYTTIQILRRRATAAEMPIVAVMRRARVLDYLLVRLAGANEYLVMPLTRQEIQEVVRRYLKHG